MQLLRKFILVSNYANSVNSLLSAKNAEKWTNVTIVDSDMREWEAPEEADIFTRISILFNVMNAKILFT